MRVTCLFFFLFTISFLCSAQVSDTVYVDEIDTIVVDDAPLVINKTVYIERTDGGKRNKSFSMLLSAGLLWDFSYYEVCETCQENFNLLQASSSNTRSFQYGLQLDYSIKKISIGIDFSYRNSSQKIDYSSSGLVLNSAIKVSYFMTGPSLGYKILEKNNWDLDISGGVLFSFTTSQTGQTIGGEYLDTVIDLSNTKLISPTNFLYHLAPAATYKINPSIQIVLTAHYYFDQYSNVTKQQSYTEQRNTLGLSTGLKYIF